MSNCICCCYERFDSSEYRKYRLTKWQSYIIFLKTGTVKGVLCNFEREKVELLLYRIVLNYISLNCFKVIVLKLFASQDVEVKWQDIPNVPEKNKDNCVHCIKEL